VRPAAAQISANELRQKVPEKTRPPVQIEDVPLPRCVVPEADALGDALGNPSPAAGDEFTATRYKPSELVFVKDGDDLAGGPRDARHHPPEGKRNGEPGGELHGHEQGRAPSPKPSRPSTRKRNKSRQPTHPNQIDADAIDAWACHGHGRPRCKCNKKSKQALTLAPSLWSGRRPAATCGPQRRKFLPMNELRQKVPEQCRRKSEPAPA
jgi:hypothetical protein